SSVRCSSRWTRTRCWRWAGSGSAETSPGTPAVTWPRRWAGSRRACSCCRSTAPCPSRPRTAPPSRSSPRAASCACCTRSPDTSACSASSPATWPKWTPTWGSCSAHRSDPRAASIVERAGGAPSGGEPVSPIPEVMRAAVVRELGSTSAIHIEQVPVPAPGPTDVLVRVLASEINHVDVFVVTGAYPTPTPFPFVVGRDLVGEIVAAGEGTGSLRVGERLWTNSLGYAGRQVALAEYALVPADRTYQLPAGADPLAAAAVLHTGATAATGLQHRARVGIGDTVLIGGGAGGVGSAAIRIASWAGARVIAT